MAENLDVFNFELSAEDMNLIASLDEGQSLFFDHRTPESAEWLGARTLEL
jgi:diketogulonate reductase-like aldo/keto reductase